MTKPAISSDLNKSKKQTVLEHAIFAICLCVIVLRTFFIESINTQSSNQTNILGGTLQSLSISTILIGLFLLWFIVNLCSKNFLYRYTAIEIGLCIFVAAAVIAWFAASNKRAAITSSITFITPIIAAVLLVQILDSYSKIKVLLYVIVILGTISALYSFCQFLWFNQIVIDEYETNLDSVLEQIHIIKNSFQHMLFEHGLYSKDVRGFFTTGNSAGSFAILAAFSAVTLLIQKIKSVKQNPQHYRSLIFLIITALIIVSGLFVTRSKGAIAGFIISSAMLLAYAAFPHWLRTHRKILLLAFIILLIALIAFAAWYAASHECLPGGNSMLVRGQYWKASLQMYLDHPFTGIGGGNFVVYYTHYKPSAALEIVADPHNFILSLLAQYGVLGLLGFLAAIGLPLIRILFVKSADTEKRSAPQNYILIAPLVVSIFGVLIHNCLDFAIFEPSILTMFWAVTACLVAMDFNRNARKRFVFQPPAFLKIASALTVLIFFVIYLSTVLFPVAKSNQKIRQANRAIADSQFHQAHNFLASAANDDMLDPAALSLNGRLSLHKFKSAQLKDRNLLFSAERNLLVAASRNPADFKNFERLTEVYDSLAELSLYPPRKIWLNKALAAAEQAVQRYPGIARLRIQAAKIAEQLDKTDKALEQYTAAVAIEDMYQVQFRTMYPGKKIYNRLGEQNYNFAKQRIKNLSE